MSKGDAKRRAREERAKQIAKMQKMFNNRISAQGPHKTNCNAVADRHRHGHIGAWTNRMRQID